MDADKPTLGIYGIPDRNNLPFPEESHDHGIVLMQNGSVKHFLQLERRTRIKHDHNLGEHIFEILQDEGLLAGDFDIAFSNNVLGSSLISKNGKIRFEGPIPHSLSSKPQKAHAYWLDHARTSWMVNHELAHVYSAMPFYGGFPDNSLLIHFDGGASASNFSAWGFNENNVSFLEAHWDLKYLSGFFNANALCFGIIGAKKEEQLAVPGKMMGLAAYGSYSEEMEFWLRKNNWFSQIWGSKKRFFDAVGRDWGLNIQHLDSRISFLQNVLATFQEIFIRETINKFTDLKKRYKHDNLVFTGGSALNIVLNSRLVRSGSFRNVMIPPCTNDSGLALGAATCLEYLKHGRVERHSPYLENWGVNKILDPYVEYSEKDIANVAEWITMGEIVGICNGKGEAGPRALGNRSLICRADDPKLTAKLSMEVKGREWYRPLAPIMLKGNIKKYTGEKEVSALGRFMLDEFSIRDGQKKFIAGAVHVDGTARIQYLEKKEDNPFVWDLLKYLEKNHDLDCLINTSFNTRGEPIVGSVDDALESARGMGLKCLVINGRAGLIK